MDGSILLRWVIWHVPFFFACRAQDYTFCLLIARYMLSDKIKDKSALKARTFLNVRDKVRVCYWYWLSLHLSTENSAGYLQHVEILKTLHWRIFTYKKHPIHRNWVINMDFFRHRHKTDMPRARIRSYNQLPAVQHFGVVYCTYLGVSGVNFQKTIVFFCLKIFLVHLKAQGEIL